MRHSSIDFKHSTGKSRIQYSLNANSLLHK